MISMKGIAYETITIDYGSQAIENRHKKPLRNESQRDQQLDNVHQSL